MPLRDDKVDVGYIDTEFSSGDSQKMNTKQIYQEENNNEINELSKELSEMGCIVDSVKRPPNICIETCVHNSNSDEENSQNNDDDAYSDEFEDDKSDVEDVGAKSETVLDGKTEQVHVSSIKLSKSQSSMSTHKAPSISGTSAGFRSLPVPTTRRINMSFTNDRLRDIERHNHILLNKILSARHARSSIPPREQSIRRPVPPAAVQRKHQQKQIDHDNMILLKKIQRAKSSAYSVRR